TWYAEKNNIDPKSIVVVSVMPCSAKKMEKDRDDQAAAGVPDVDFAITTRELGMMIERAGIDFNKLPDEDFDPALGISTGASVIFGATGGVMEAALRTAVETLTGEELAKVEFTDVRGTQGIKEAKYNVAGLEVNVCVCSGLSNANKVLNMVKSGEKNYHFIEIMCCPGGCVNGGGQPIQPAYVRNTVDLKAVRAAALYAQDESMPLRKSHESPIIKMLYDDYFGKPGSHKAHEVLHTTYAPRKKY
ncbi:MAG: iron hydrogenase small subunit, partial [Clostridia bacterium]|nr:iron hydrogenase small subunit [Clostridia bacterium]